MADQAGNIAKKRALDYMVTATVKAVLVMTNTQADGETAKDSSTCADFTHDAFDGSDGAPLTLTLTAAQDNTNDRGKVTQASDEMLWPTGPSGGTRAIQGIMFVEWNTTVDNSKFLGYAELPGGPWTANGDSLKVACSSQGIFYIG
jgi:hypothetical protein